MRENALLILIACVVGAAIAAYIAMRVSFKDDKDEK